MRGKEREREEERGKRVSEKEIDRKREGDDARTGERGRDRERFT